MAVIVEFSPVNMLTTLQKEDLSLLSRFVLCELDVKYFLFESNKFNIESKNMTFISPSLPHLQCHMPLFRKLMIWEILNQKLL